MSDDTDDRPIAPARKTDEEYLAELARQHAEALPAGEALTQPETRPLEGEFVRAEPEDLAQTLNSMVPDQAAAAAPAAEAQEVEVAPEEPPPPADVTPAADEEAQPIADEPQGEPTAEQSPPAPPPVTDEEAEPVAEEQPAAAPLPAPVEAIIARPAISSQQTAPNPLLRLLLQILVVATLVALAAALYLMTR